MRMPKPQTAVLTQEQQIAFEAVKNLFDPCAPVSEQSDDYKNLAKEFNATLSEEQRGFLRAV